MEGAEFRRNVAGTMLINGDSGQSLGGYTGHSRITIEGGLWNVRGTTADLTASAMCISIGHATDIVIRDLEIRDTPGFHAVELNSTNHATITNCRFRGYVDPGGRDFSEALQLDLAKSNAVFGGFGPYDNTETKDVTISGNTFVSCGSGVRIRTVIVGDPEDTKLPDSTQTNASQSMRNIAVTGNSFRNGGGYDNVIAAQGETSGTILNLAITGNVIDGTTGNQSGIRLHRVSRATVAHNVISNVDNTGIPTEAQNNTTISGNVVWTAGDHGITMVASDYSNPIGNTIRDAGIFVNGPGTDIQVRDNFVDGANRNNSSSYAIRFSTTAVAGIAVSGNKCRPGSTPTTKAVRGLSITSGNTGVHRFGNDCRGTWSGAGGQGIDDDSTSPDKTATRHRRRSRVTRKAIE
ncbi:right-handed parallel beta-helix repeat-containing protein [Streptomyces sp. 135]|uniref:right-handed parallel beta-helix repeat-containing protein n=1 Tax=Streptomyces sp. 135 TaxID=2838850 RepID=UPI001CBABCC8|nr:right-handed parallel beta-helix repeat-containing protein [Streptomyces sp. 135]